MGISKMDNIYDYWNKDKGNSIIKNIMSRNNWIFIWRALFHLPIPILDLFEEELNYNCQKYWNPFEYFSIDESMRRFK